MFLGLAWGLLTVFIVRVLGNIFYNIFIIENIKFKDINQNIISFDVLSDNVKRVFEDSRK